MHNKERLPPVEGVRRWGGGSTGPLSICICPRVPPVALFVKKREQSITNQQSRSSRRKCWAGGRGAVDAGVRQGSHVSCPKRWWDRLWPPAQWEGCSSPADGPTGRPRAFLCGANPLPARAPWRPEPGVGPGRCPLQLRDTGRLGLRGIAQETPFRELSEPQCNSISSGPLGRAPHLADPVGVPTF